MAALIIAIWGQVSAAVFTVTNPGDTGAGTLRQALAGANANPGPDLIEFNIPGAGPHTISPEADLPTITGPVTIDGFTQSGASPNTMLAGDNAVLMIEINGANSGTGAGLVVTGGDSTIRGLCINRFSAFLLRLQSSGNVVAGNFLGTDVTGLMSFDASEGGVFISGANNRIGGPFPEERNIISGTLSFGVRMDGAGTRGNEVQGNFIGTDVTGGGSLPNSLDGIHISNGASSNTIGGFAASLPPGNTIAFNGGSGVLISGGSGNLILGNRIFSNAGLGIDLGPSGVTANDPLDADTGANGLQNFPVLSAAMSAGDSTMLDVMFNSHPDTLYRFEFFVSPECDPSGNGEGREPLFLYGQVTDGNGDANFVIQFPFGLPAGAVVTVTATDPAFNTSEFSPCARVEGSGSFRFSTSRYSVNESGGPAVITVVRTNGSMGAASVKYSTRNGTAMAGADYTAAAGTLSFAEGEKVKTFNVPILNDSLADGTESVVLMLADPSADTGLVGPTTALLAILDDEAAPMLKITLAEPSVIVSWPTNAPGFLLHSADRASTGTVWSALSYQVVVDGDQNTVTLPASGGPKFYRLAKDADVAPKLTIGSSGGSVTISWPSSVIGYELQSREALSGGTDWEAVSEPVNEGTEEFSVTVQIAGEKKFYRLARP